MARLQVLGLLVAGVLLAAGCSSNSNNNQNGQNGNANSGTSGSSSSSKTVSLSFHYPVGVSGPLATIINGYVDQFQKENPNIKVTPVYDGDYDTVLAKTTQLAQAGSPPDVAIINAAGIYSLTDANLVLPLDDYIKQSGGDAFTSDFFPAFLQNSQLNGHIYSIPFQRSTLIMYYNKDAFQEVGLDPNKAPQSWDEVIADAQKLTKKDSSGNVTRWGVGFPSSGTAYWEFQALAIEEGQNVFDNNAGNKVLFNAPQTVQALQFLVDLSKTQKVMPSGTVSWDTLPSEFDAGKYGIVFHSTGSLTSVLKGAQFQVGTAFMPKLQQFGTPTGGGNLYMFKGIPKDHQDAAWKFIQWMSSPARQAQWTIDSGYVAARKSAWDQASLQQYVQAHPQVQIARDQLQYAQNELGTHQKTEVQMLLTNAVQAAVTGEQSPQDALNAAQSQADKILGQFKN